jgi:ABC-type glycerol-3-phosphate transport system substrate-binding protein
MTGVTGVNGFSRRRMVRTGALGGGAIAIGAALAACGPGGPATKEKVPVDIKVWTWTNIINKPVWDRAQARFGESHAKDKLTVNLQYFADQPTYWTKLTAEYAAGTPPDVIYGSPLETQDVASKGLLKDLSAVIKRDKFDLNDINPPAQVPYMFEGKVWGLASWNDTRILSYNVNAFKGAGIPLPPQTLDGPGWTIDDFISAAKRLNEPQSNKYAYVPDDITGGTLRLPWLFGGYYWNDEKVPTRSGLNTPETIKGFELGRDLIAAHRVMPPRALPATLGGHDKMFPAGMMPIAWAAYKHVTAGWAEIKDFEWAVAPLPRGTRRMHHVSPQAFAAVSLSKTPEEAWTVVKDYSTGEANEIMATVSSLPSYKKTDVYKVAAVPAERRWMIKLLADALNAGKSLVPHPNVKLEMNNAMNAAVNDMLDEKISPSEAAKTASDKVNALFDANGVRPK